MENLQEAFNYLNKDKVMCFLINKFSKNIQINDRREANDSKSIANLIIEQQVSFKAAITIKKRFNIITKGLSNKQIIEMDEKKLQSIGISFKKAQYIKNVYNYFNDIDFDFQKLDENQIKDELIKIKGIGKWTIEMYLIFIKGSQNIFSMGDLALINSIKINYKINNLKKDSLKYLIDSWSPYKTVASLLLWKSIEEKVFYEG
jgi:DNA-3-methyladenine glycosylase II|tara:strand:+ start:109 stop:717 length:609 start_codon:yes stop_codon:yes gene_type:complete